MSRAFAELCFTPSVLEVQKEQGSAEAYAEFLDPAAEPGNLVGPAEEQFIHSVDGFYQATISENGWPYVQFRGGPKGFLNVLDLSTIAYADFRGNRQYLSVGNLRKNERVSLILMDYPNRRRLKIWGKASLVSIDEDEQLVRQLQNPNYRGLPERAVVISVEAMDWNCPQHIPQRMTREEFEPYLVPIRAELERLRTENEELKSFLKPNS